MTDITLSSNKPNIQEVINFILSNLDSRKAEHSIEQDSKIAYRITTIYSLENSIVLCKDKELDRLVSIAGGLEIPNGTMVKRNKDWAEINELIKTLQARYL